MKKVFSLIQIILLCSLLWGCNGGLSDLSKEKKTANPINSVDFKYADQLSVEEYEGGYVAIHINDGLDYFVLPEGADLPEWMNEETLKKYTVIKKPLGSIYLAASSAMDLFNQLGAVNKVSLTSTKENDWSLEEIKDKVASDEISYVGKYSAPDYEAILYKDCDLAIESTMIYHSPEVKESIEALGVPVLVERSSYEAHPLGRLEWIKLYGLLLGKEEEANAFFDEMQARLEKVISETEVRSDEERPKVAFFSISVNNYATVRKPNDYISQMIYMAGGEYVMKDLPVADENALSTTNIQLEIFYDYATKADVLIYNSAIQGEIRSIDELLDKFEELAGTNAVKSGNVWCTDKSVYQKSSGICEMTEEMYLIIKGEVDDATLKYFHKLS